jgi:hypothetical protein
MQDTSAWEPTIRKTAKRFPKEVGAIAPTTQRMKPVPDHLGPKLAHAAGIAGDCMIVHVALHHSAKPEPHVLNSVVNSTAQLLFDIMEFGTQSFGNGLAFHEEAFSITGFTAYVSETQEIEGLGLPLP